MEKKRRDPPANGRENFKQKEGLRMRVSYDCCVWMTDRHSGQTSTITQNFSPSQTEALNYKNPDRSRFINIVDMSIWSHHFLIF